MNKKMIITGIGLLVVAYIVAAVIPNLFVKKGFNTAKSSGYGVVAHRGGADLAPENSLTCIKKGMETGADLIEIDIHLSKDNQIVVNHDETIDRMTDGSGAIADMTLEELKKFHIVNKKGELTADKLPTLEEVLELVKDGSKLLIEIKRTKNLYVGIEEKLLEILDAYGMRYDVVIQSFNDSVLEILHGLDEKLRLEKLIIFKFPGLPVIYDGTFSKFNVEKYHYISSFNFFYLSLPPYLIKQIHEWGKEVKVWTLTLPEDAPDLDVDYVITNRPDLYIKK